MTTIYQAVLTFGMYSDYTEMTLGMASTRSKAITIGRQYLANYIEHHEKAKIYPEDGPEIFIREYPVDQLNPRYSADVQNTNPDYGDEDQDESSVLTEELEHAIKIVSDDK